MKNRPNFAALSLDVNGVGSWLRGDKSIAHAMRESALPLTFLFIGWVDDVSGVRSTMRAARGYYGVCFRAKIGGVIWTHYSRMRYHLIGKTIWTCSIFVDQSLKPSEAKILITQSDWIKDAKVSS